MLCKISNFMLLYCLESSLPWQTNVSSARVWGEIDAAVSNRNFGHPYTLSADNGLAALAS
jgi:hypothetical protein